MKRKKYEADIPWCVEQFSGGGIFDDLSNLLNLSDFSSFPSAAQLTQLMTQLQADQKLKPVEFIAQSDSMNWHGMSYEELIFAKQKIPTRIDNWHDLFNACIWALFPNTKRCLNELHVNDITQYGLKQRTKQRDALTLFDECGVVLAYTQDTDKTALKTHLWLESFWQNRSRWFTSIKPFIFGHAMYEMSLKPFIGLTAKAYFLRVSDDFFQWPAAQQYRYLDQQLAREIAEQATLKNNQHLSPLPILGVPFWYDDNQEREFYLNENYFRPKRQPKVIKNKEKDIQSN
ncbi:DUF3025 domain-containing protein [Catenovulum adriaticum]|uniref:DUF3025 domain-containing protein n=1 Tax=Catenovulum adriaticum TaxID=2984846 RepID=A0ABY7AK60_9ALTE|nr:DUF3025 domain-containing protein [Catenovulum sp. TS8]WAJ69031.1 DUF3025 domain-containing protein [Catenovulum sp. TS8]